MTAFFFWQHCLACATLSRLIAASIDYPNPQEAYAAGLLHDIGIMILNVYSRVTYDEFLSLLPLTSGSMTRLEDRIIGAAHDRIGDYFSRIWDLPERIVAATAYHHRSFTHAHLTSETELLVSIVALANFIAWSLGLGSINLIRQHILQPEVGQRIPWKHLHLTDLIRQLGHEMQGIGEIYHFHFPPTDLFCANTLRKSMELASLNTLYASNQDRVVPVKTDQKKPSSSTWESRPLMSQGVQRIIHETLTVYQQDFQFDRIFLMMRSSKSRDLVVVADFNTTSGDLAGYRLQVSDELPQIIDCLRKRRPILSMITAEEATPVEADMFDILQTEEVGFIPLTNNNRVLGLIGVDNVVSGDPIRSDVLRFLCMAVNELGQVIDNAQDFENRLAGKQSSLLNGLMSPDILLNDLEKRMASRSKHSPLSIIIFNTCPQTVNSGSSFQADQTVLDLIANTIHASLRQSDGIGYLGQRAILVVLENTPIQETLLVAKRIQSVIFALALPLKKRRPSSELDVEIHAAERDAGTQCASDLIKKALKKGNFH